jgi:hypothetical protein
MGFQPNANLYPVAFGTRPENLEVPHIDARNPTPHDFLYPVGKFWVNVGNSIWVLLNIDTVQGVTTANWVEITNAFGPATQYTENTGIAIPFANNLNIFGTNGIQTTGSGDTVTISLTGIDATQYTTNSGVAVPAANNLNVFGGTGITTSGAGSTITITATGAGELISLTGDAGGAVSPNGSGNINLSGASTTYVTGNPGAHSLKTEVVSTLNTFLLGQGATTPSIALGPLTNGQLIIGNTGNAPSLNTLTAGTGISISNGAGTITISSSFSGDNWVLITANQTLVANTGYFCVSPGGALSLALPTTGATVGSIIEVVLDGATSWTITQGVGQQIRYGTQQTTSGAGGSLASNNQGDSVRLVCEVANTRWVATSGIGTKTVV